MVLELDERIDQELKELYKTLEIEGKLLSGEQLAGYYSTFRSRFGPDRLKNLDGEALLNTMQVSLRRVEKELLTSPAR